MRSNCVGHIGNDTFIAATRNKTENMFLVTSKLVEERVTSYPLRRRVRFAPFSELNFMDDITLSHSRDTSQIIESNTSTMNPLEDHSQDVRHSFHTSVDGKLLAVISTGKRKHYLIDVQSACVCEFKTSDIVINVTWHPTNATRLMLLLKTGKLLLLGVNTARLGVTFEDKREVDLKAIITSLRDYILSSNGAIPPSQLTDTCGCKQEVLKHKATLMIAHHKSKTPEKMTSTLSLPELSSAEQASKISSEDLEEAKQEEEKGTVICTNVEAETPEIEHLDKGANNSQCSLAGMCVIPASRSLPVILLVLGIGGDIFSVKVDAEGAPTSLAKEYDGRIDVILDEDYLQHCKTSPFPCVHYLVRGAGASDVYTEYPLAIGTAVLDEDLGYHSIFVLYSSGVLRGSWFCEPDLLCRNHMRRHMDFTIHLDGMLPPFPLTPQFPSRAHLVGLQTCKNATLIRYDREGYLCVWPTWSRKAACWVYRNEGTDGCQRVPVAGRGTALPEPVVMRLPYDLSGASVGIGVNDILIFPEVMAAETGVELEASPRFKVIVTKIANLILSSLYARGEKYSLTFYSSVNCKNNRKNNDNNKNNNGDGDGENTKCNKNTAQHVFLERLLELTAECHQKWLCGYPHDAINNIIGDLEKGVKNAHMKSLVRQNALQERGESLLGRVRQLLQRQQELTQTVVNSQSVIRDAIVHRYGVDSMQEANKALGKTHKLLNELEALAEERKGGEQRKF